MLSREQRSEQVGRRPEVWKHRGALELFTCCCCGRTGFTGQLLVGSEVGVSTRPLHRGFKPSQIVPVPLTQVWTGRDEAPPLQVNPPLCLFYSSKSFC